MAIKSLNEIILGLLDFYRVAQPDLDTKEGTVARDLFIDGPSSQFSLLYDQIAQISNLQSLRLVAGADLDKLAQNLGATRKTATASSGIALLTFSSIPATIGINSNELITAQNGNTFAVINGLSIDASKNNYYKSIATKYRNDLDFLGITDQYAVEIPVRATVPGSTGNISKYSLNRTSIPGVSNVTNTFAFQGGADQEDDASFRNRVLAIFSGSNIGTALGYRNTALTNSFVQDALVISPGDVLMTRDGTIVGENDAGEKIIVSEGTGGKVDIIILGSNINHNIDTFVYFDRSNVNDPTDNSNDIILGQIPGDEDKTITRKRIDNIAAGILPAQPVEEIVEVSGTLSGSNFLPKSIDELGRVSGNYELIKDTGVYNGSPWAQDKFKWVSNKISLFQEDAIKTKFNGQDTTTFTDVIEIPKIQQNISITNENSLVQNSDRSIINLLHKPATNITRVLNTNTGERYTVIDQNLDDTSPFNATGRIKISGNTLPSSSDILQVDYTWIVDYDPFSDYDGKILSNNSRSSVDSIDWGISNAVKNEKVLFSLNNDSTFYTGSLSLPVSSVITGNIFKSIVGSVENSNIVNFSNRLSITLSAINEQLENIESIKLCNTEKEIYITASNDGVFFNNRVVVGTEIKYNVSIVLPTDTDVVVGDIVEIIYNTEDVFNVADSVGSFINEDITIPASNIENIPNKILLNITYISSAPDLLSYGITNLPISREGNGFLLNSNIGFKNNIISNSLSKQNQTVQKNSSDDFYIKLSLTSLEYTLTADNIITVINIANGNEYWNADGYGSISIDIDNNYLLTLSGFNSPAVGDNVLVVYKSIDNQRGQPFTFDNKIVKYNLNRLSFDSDLQKFTCPINDFENDGYFEFDILDQTTSSIIDSFSDGYITGFDNDSLTLNSLTAIFSDIEELKSKKIFIKNSSLNNNGVYNILNMIDSDTLTISPLVENISNNQISVIRLSDSKDLWNPTTGIISENTIILPSGTSAAQAEQVLIVCFTNKNLRQSPTRLAVSLSDQLINSGVLTASGTSITNVNDIVFTATQNGLKQNLLEALKTFLGLASTTNIGSDKSIIRLLKLEKVLTTTDDEVISSEAEYDVLGTEVYNNLLYSNEMNYNNNLNLFDFNLPSTTNNLDNIPEIGDKLRVSFMYATENDNENLYFTRNGLLYTNKKFATINKIYPGSGFNSSQSARFTTSFFTQPATGSRYRAFYDYLAPKQNERILIRSNYNQVIGEVVFAVETSRPINADVLVREAKQILVDATINIVVKNEFVDSAAIVIQNTKDRLTSTINTNTLGDSINSSDLIAAAQSVDGVERARIVYFNKDGELGQVLTITAEKNEYFVANDVVVNQETV